MAGAASMYAMRGNPAAIRPVRHRDSQVSCLDRRRSGFIL